VGDITYIWTWEGWAYLASVIDLASRRVVGWRGRQAITTLSVEPGQPQSFPRTDISQP